jgi:hypothetical protein
MGESPLAHPADWSVGGAADRLAIGAASAQPTLRELDRGVDAHDEDGKLKESLPSEALIHYEERGDDSDDHREHGEDDREDEQSGRLPHAGDATRTSGLSEQDYYEHFRRRGVVEDTAAILAIEAASGRLGTVKVKRGLTDDEITAEVARRAALVCERSGRYGCSLLADHDGDCVLLCAAHPFRMALLQPIDGVDACDIEPVLARFGHLCGPCYGRARNNLHQAPQLLAHIRGQVVPSMESARGPRVSGTRDAPIPLRPDPVHDADDLYSQIVNWIVAFARQTGIRPPATAVAFLQQSVDAARLPSWARGQAAAYTLAEDLVRWYEQHELQLMTALPPLTVRAWCDDIDAIVGAFRKRYPQAERKPRQAAPRECPTCGENAVVVEFYAAGVEVECRHCGERIPEAQHDAYVDWAETSATPRAVSLVCDRGRHHLCGWVDCSCSCHTDRAA